MLAYGLFNYLLWPVTILVAYWFVFYAVKQYEKKNFDV